MQNIVNHFSKRTDEPLNGMQKTEKETEHRQRSTRTSRQTFTAQIVNFKANRETYRKTNKQSDTLTQMDKQTDIHKGRQSLLTIAQTNRQTDRQIFKKNGNSN
jgi:hypothetical protein